MAAIASHACSSSYVRFACDDRPMNDIFISSPRNNDLMEIGSKGLSRMNADIDQSDLCHSRLARLQARPSPLRSKLTESTNRVWNPKRRWKQNEMELFRLL